MSETLGQKQRRFCQMEHLLISELYRRGYEYTKGDAYRDPRVHGAIGVKMGYGHPKSAHKQRLAVDINLFKDGVFLTATEAHRELGEFWESLGSDHRWGGRFDDGNHYSIEHEGIK